MTHIALLAFTAVVLQASRDSDLVQLAPIIVDAAVSAGVPKSRSQSAEGRHLFVDLTSFALNGNSAMNAVASTGQLALALGPTVRDATESEAVQCSEADCWIEDDALFVRLDSLHTSAFGSLEALVTCLWPDRRPSGRSGVGMTQLRIWLAKRGNVWMKTRSEIVKRT